VENQNKLSQITVNTETEDTLLGGSVRLRQPRDGFRAAIDTVFLAASVPAKSGQSVLELGIGTGGAALCLSHRITDLKILGMDINSSAIALARENILLNGADKNVDAVIGDVAEPLPKNFEVAFDHVMMNPPFLPENTNHVSPNPGRALATKETTANFPRWFKFAHDALVHKGYLTVVHRADRLAELIKFLPANFGGVSILPLWPHEGEEAKRVIIQLRKGTRSPTRILPGLSIHNADGTYRDVVTRVLNGAAIEI